VLGGAYDVVVDATSVYVLTGADFGSIVKVGLDGGMPVTLVEDLASPAGLAIDATSAYWTDSSIGTISKVPLDGGTTTTLAAELTNPQTLLVDATGIYWEDICAYTLMKMPVDGGVPVTLVSGGSNQPLGMALDSTSLYWSASGLTGSVMRLTPK
jgi:sugar lactone lactonase YvrE